MKTLKKLVAVLFAALLLGGPFVPMVAYSQNFIQTQNLYGVGVQTNHNSAGTTWGQEATPSANTWSLGYAPSSTGGLPPSSIGSKNMTWDNTPALTAVAPLVLSQTNFGSAANLQFGVYASSTIPVSVGGSSFINLLSSAGSLTMTATPAISTINAQGLPIAGGTFVILGSTQSITFTFADNAGTAGTLLKTFNGATVAVSSMSYAGFIFNSVDGFWHETNVP